MVLKSEKAAKVREAERGDWDPLLIVYGIFEAWIPLELHRVNDTHIHIEVAVVETYLNYVMVYGKSPILLLVTRTPQRNIWVMFQRTKLMGRNPISAS
ncbi:unnamed protein product [Cochlearia groenlandica]